MKEEETGELRRLFNEEFQIWIVLFIAREMS
jgi:hypothetical protein